MSELFTTKELSSRVLEQLDNGDEELRRWVDDYLTECPEGSNAKVISEILEAANREGGFTRAQMRSIAKIWEGIKEAWPDYKISNDTVSEYY